MFEQIIETWRNLLTSWQYILVASLYYVSCIIVMGYYKLGLVKKYPWPSLAFAVFVYMPAVVLMPILAPLWLITLPVMLKNREVRNPLD